MERKEGAGLDEKRRVLAGVILCYKIVYCTCGSVVLSFFQIKARVTLSYFPTHYCIDSAYYVLTPRSSASIALVIEIPK
jgi:hypothetical protein